MSSEIVKPMGPYERCYTYSIPISFTKIFQIDCKIDK